MSKSSRRRRRQRRAQRTQRTQPKRKPEQKGRRWRPSIPVLSLIVGVLGLVLGSLALWLGPLRANARTTKLTWTALDSTVTTYGSTDSQLWGVTFSGTVRNDSNHDLALRTGLFYISIGGLSCDYSANEFPPKECANPDARPWPQAGASRFGRGVSMGSRTRNTVSLSGLLLSPGQSEEVTGEIRADEEELEGVLAALQGERSDVPIFLEGKIWTTDGKLWRLEQPMRRTDLAQPDG